MVAIKNVSIGDALLLDLDQKEHLHFVLMEESQECDYLVFMVSLQTFDENVKSIIKRTPSTVLNEGEHAFCTQPMSWIDYSIAKIMHKKSVSMNIKQSWGRIDKYLYDKLIKGFFGDSFYIKPVIRDKFFQMKAIRDQYCQHHACDDFCEEAIENHFNIN